MKLSQSFFAVIMALCVLITGISCSTGKHTKSTKLNGVWQAQPIVVDGNSKDWPSPYPSYDPKALIGYAYSNDSENLYLTMETGDEMTQMKILKQGFTLWIDTTGNKDKSVAIHFPLESDNEDLQMAREQGQQHAQQGLGKKLLFDKIRKGVEDVNQYSLEGFKGCNGNFTLKQTNDCGITVAIAMDEYNELIWEAAIPFKAIYNKTQLTKRDRGRSISVCFALKGVKRPPSKTTGQGENNGSGMHGGGGGMGGGMRGGGGGMRGAGSHGGANNAANEREHLYETTNTWKQFVLELKP
jgi:hypothetical protein